MTDEYWSRSTYRHEHQYLDEDGDPLGLANADPEYRMTAREGRGPVLFSFTPDDAEFEVVDEGQGEAAIEIPAADLTVVGKAWEEWRVTLPDGRSEVTHQGPVVFKPVSTEPAQ